MRSGHALLELVARGASARATARTGVHDHSSRSHAVLVLAVEERWAVESGFKARRSYLTLVDLAGAEGMQEAHGGYADAAGIGTNLGLLLRC